MEYEAYVMKEDFDNGEQWDNSSVAVVIKRRFVEEMERKGLIRQPTEFELADTEEIPVVNDLDKTEEIPVIDDLDKTEEIPVVDEDKKNKGLFGKLKDSINTIVTRFKNRNQQKLNPGGQENMSREDDNSEYYASLATKTVEKEDPFAQYMVEPKNVSTLKVEDLKVSTDKSKETQNKEYDDDGR